MHPLSPALAGLGFGLSLIVAIGAQNAFVLRQGLRGEHVGGVVAICVGSDAILIAAGVAGVGTLVTTTPTLIEVVRVGGAAFLLAYAGFALLRAVRPSVLDTETARASDRGAVLATCVALTWLNPHVFLDTVLLLGSIAGTHGGNRWWFAVGAIAGSTLWFSMLGYGARLLRPVFQHPAAWRVLDVLIATTMTVIAISLLTSG